MARPGLEPGTPRFSVVDRNRSNKVESPAIQRVRVVSWRRRESPQFPFFSRGFRHRTPLRCLNTWMDHAQYARVLRDRRSDGREVGRTYKPRGLDDATDYIVGAGAGGPKGSLDPCRPVLGLNGASAGRTPSYCVPFGRCFDNPRLRVLGGRGLPAPALLQVV